MPAALEITLRSTGWDLGFTPRRLHGLVCSLFEAKDGGLVGEGSHHAQDKPFSVTPPTPDSSAGSSPVLRLNWLPDSPEPVVLDGSVPVTTVRTGPTAIDVVGQQVWRQPYADLARLPPIWSGRFEFRSPTYFSRSGRTYPLPDPELVFGRLGARWNRWADREIAIADEDLRSLVRHLTVASHDIRTVTTEPGTDRERTAFVGLVRFVVHRRGRTDRMGRIFAALSAFAEFSGVGSRTAHGLGAVRVLPDG